MSTAAGPETLQCPSCGGEGWYVTADPLPSGEPGEPYQVLCPNAIFHEFALTPKPAARGANYDKFARPADGTTTDCPLVGVHEHAFRGPHRFHEWDPANYQSPAPALKEPTDD